MYVNTDRARGAQATDERREPRSRVTCCNCGNAGWNKEFETDQGTMACGDCGQTQRFRVDPEAPAPVAGDLVTQHRRARLPRRGGNSFYRDRSDLTSLARTLCGAPVGMFDVPFRSAMLVEWERHDGVRFRPCPLCEAASRGDEAGA